ncbi:hypothetical protein ACVMBY_001252 [Bradyrhizobium huanghuaihaiense]|nr:hypothetical protein [Bradyrhizobium huanghuaihaiense]
MHFQIERFILAMLPYPDSPAILRFLAGSLFFPLIYGGMIKYFERRLLFWQAYLIALVAHIFLAALLFTYGFANSQIGFPPLLDGLANLAWVPLWALMITRLAASYGIKKEGRFGLGAKVALATIVIMLAFIVALAGLNLLIGADIFSWLRR